MDLPAMPRIFLCFALYLGIGSAPIAIREEGLQPVKMSDWLFHEVIAISALRHCEGICLASLNDDGPQT